MKSKRVKAPAILLLIAVAISGCSGNINTTPTFAAQLPALAEIAPASPVQPFTSLTAVGTDDGEAVVPLFTVQSVPTDVGSSGVILWGTKDPVTGEIGVVTEASVFGLEPPGGQVHAFFDATSSPVLFRDDASGYAIAVTYTSATSLAVSLCDPSGRALAQASATVVAGVAEGPPATDGGSCAVRLAGADLSARGASARSVAQAPGGVPTNVGDLDRLAPLFKSILYVIGLAYAIDQIFKYLNHKDNPSQAQLATAVILIFIAAGVLFLPATLDGVGSSLVDTTSDMPIDGISPIYVAPPAGTSS